MSINKKGKDVCPGTLARRFDSSSWSDAIGFHPTDVLDFTNSWGEIASHKNCGIVGADFFEGD